MRFLRPLLIGVFVGANAPLLMAPALAQTCACPPAGEGATGPAAYGEAGPVIVADEPPPPIPEYNQPPPPGPDYYWTPGYWAWNNEDYYWVPGVWVPPPQTGVVWTPGYWAFSEGVYLFRRGYWGPRVGFYGGVNYGYGYFGHGYEGGRWDGDRFYYNTAVNNLGPKPPPNVYRAPVTIDNRIVNNVAALNGIPNVNRTSFVGGPGGVKAAPTAQERQAGQEQRIPPTAQQRHQARAAAVDPKQFLDANRGKPPVAATPRPADFKGPGVVPAHAVGGPMPEPTRNGGPPPTAKLPPESRPAADSGDCPAARAAPSQRSAGRPTQDAVGEPLARAAPSGSQAAARSTDSRTSACSRRATAPESREDCTGQGRTRQPQTSATPKRARAAGPEGAKWPAARSRRTAEGGRHSAAACRPDAGCPDAAYGADATDGNAPADAQSRDGAASAQSGDGGASATARTRKTRWGAALRTSRPTALPALKPGATQ